MPDPKSPTHTLSFDLDGVPYSVDWSQNRQPTNDELTALAATLRPTRQHRNAALYYNQPKTPAGINPNDVSQYQAKYFSDPAAAGSAPAQLLATIQRLPLADRDKAIPPEWSPVGRAALLSAAYTANPSLPLTSDYLANRNLAELGVSSDQAKKQGIPAAIDANTKTRNRLLAERQNLTAGPMTVASTPGAMPYVSEGSIFTGDKAKAAKNQARLKQVDAALEALGAPQAPPVLAPDLGAGMLNKGVSSIISQQDFAQADPSATGALLDLALGKGTNAALQTTKGFGAGFTKGLMSFGEPENLALMAAGAPLGALPGASEAMLTAFGGQALKGAYDEFRAGDTGGALGGLAAFAAPFALHKAEAVRTNRILTRVAAGEIPMPPKMVFAFENQLGMKKGTLTPDMAQQIAYQISNPAGYAIDHFPAPDLSSDPYLQTMMTGEQQTLPAAVPPAAPPTPDVTPNHPLRTRKANGKNPLVVQPPDLSADPYLQQMMGYEPDSALPALPPIQQGYMSPSDIGVNPALQYKKTGIVDSKNQVTDALKGTSTYDVDQGGTWTVYRDADGNVSALNSHHRRELANRADRFVRVGPDGSLTDVPKQVPVRILDAKDGWTLEAARSAGALENVRDGKGTALDALEAMQGLNITPADFSRYGVSTTGKVARNIDALGNLGADALTRVKMGDIEEDAAAGIGSVKGLSPEAQNAALSEAIERGYSSYDKTRSLANEYLQDQQSGLLAKEIAGQQTSMFGDEIPDKVSSTRGLRVEIKDAAAKRIQAQYRALLMPTDAALREGEQIDISGRKSDAARLAENSKALKERMSILFDNDSVRAEIARLAGEVGNGKITKQQATDAVAKLIHDNVGRSINDLTDHGLNDRASNPPRPGNGERVSVPDGNTGTASLDGLGDGSGSLFDASAEPEPAATPAPSTETPAEQSTNLPSVIPGKAFNTSFRERVKKQAGRAFDHIPAAVLEKAEALHNKLNDLHQRLTGKPAIDEDGHVVKTPLGDAIRDRMTSISAGLYRVAWDTMRVERNMKGADPEKVKYAYDLLQRAEQPIPDVLTKPATDKMSWMAQQDGSKWSAFSKPFTPDEQAIFDKAESEGAIQKRTTKDGQIQYRNSSANLPEWVENARKPEISQTTQETKAPEPAPVSEPTPEPKSASPKNPNDLTHEIDASIEKLSNLSSPNAKAADIQLNRLEKLGINVDNAREILQTYKDLQRKDFGRGEEGTEDYQNARADAFDDFIDELSRADATDIEPPAPTKKGKSGASSGASAAVVTNTDGGAAQRPNPVKHVVDAEIAPAVDAAAARVEQFHDELQQLLSPASRSEAAGKMGRALREMGAKLAQRYEYAAEAFKGAARAFDKMPESARLDFIDNIETGKGHADPKLQKIAAALKEALDLRVKEVQDFGDGHLENLIENYFPHLWEQADKGNLISRLFAKKPLEGQKSFLKQRSIPTTKEGMSWRVYDKYGNLNSTHTTEADAAKASASLPESHLEAPLKPVSTNPVELTMLKMREMDKYILAQKLLEEAKQTKIGDVLDNGKPAMLAKFFRATEKTPDGWKKLDDRIGTVYGGTTVDVKEAFDQQVWDKLNKLVSRLNADAPLTDTRSVKIGSRGWGAAASDGSAIKTKTGGDLSVKIHELGHILDSRYGLWDWLQKRDGSVRVKGVKGARKTMAQELRDLADLRYEGQEDVVTDGYRKYVRTREEKVANALTAYIYAPEKMAEVAPTVKKRLDSFISRNPEMAQLQQIKPSLVLGERTDSMDVGGLIVRGHYYAPAEAADVFNNYLSPGLRGQAWYDALNSIGNAMNQAQLGFSGFHLMFTAMDSAVSKFALGIEQAGAGKFKDAAKSFATTPIAPFANYLRGSKVLSDYFAASNVAGGGRLTPIIDSLIKAGGRVKMDSFYKSGAIEGMWSAFREGRYVSGALKAPFAAIEAVSKPIMEVLVPRMKLGIFADLARFELERLPKDATVDQVREVMAKVWDSVDNRMGQMVYDNLFWSKKTKDFAMIATRSLGWNIGTLREIGGGFIDTATVIKRNKANIQGAKEAAASGLPFVADPVITHRMAYVAALPVVVGIAGALLHTAMTGHLPDDIEDMYYPRTGRVKPDGKPERIQIASYLKDVVAYGQHPLQTLGHKTHPLIASMIEMLQNKDFYGTEIIDPDSSPSQKAKDAAKFAAQQFMPFSFRNGQQFVGEGKQGVISKTVTKAGSYIGLTPAPADTDRTNAEKMIIRYYSDKLPAGARKEADVKATDVRKNIRDLSRTGGDVRAAASAAITSGELTQKQALAAIRQGKQPPLLHMYKMLTAEEALNVYEASSPAERFSVQKTLMQKIQQYAKQHGRDSAVLQRARKLGVVR